MAKFVFCVLQICRFMLFLLLWRMLWLLLLVDLGKMYIFPSGYTHNDLFCLTTVPRIVYSFQSIWHEWSIDYSYDPDNWFNCRESRKTPIRHLILLLLLQVSIGFKGPGHGERIAKSSLSEVSFTLTSSVQPLCYMMGPSQAIWEGQNLRSNNKRLQQQSLLVPATYRTSSILRVVRSAGMRILLSKGAHNVCQLIQTSSIVSVALFVFIFCLRGAAF